MKFSVRYIYLLFILFFLAGKSNGQTLPGLVDSVFAAMHYEEFDSLKQFFPTYKELKTTLDSMDIDKQAQQILLAQKQGEYALRRSFKSFKKQADAIDIPLNKVEKDDVRHLVQTYDGKKFSVVEIQCHYRKRAATIFFTVIELNDVWYLGEDFRIEKREVEEEPDYEKIDREAERRREKRAKDKEQALDKAERDSAKAEKLEKIEAKKKELEDAKLKKAEEKAKLKAAREEEKRKKKEALEQKKKEKAEKKKSPDKTAPADTIHTPQQDTIPPPK